MQPIFSNLEKIFLQILITRNESKFIGIVYGSLQSVMINVTLYKAKAGELLYKKQEEKKIVVKQKKTFPLDSKA